MSGAGVSTEGSVTVCGRRFERADLATMARIIASSPGCSRAEIARRICDALGWLAANGDRKAMSCRVALLKLERQGLVRLPPPRNGNGNGRAYRPSSSIRVPREPIEIKVADLAGLDLRPVEGRRGSRTWNEAVSRFHYLGYTPLPGAQIRYLITAERGLLGALGFSASAWRVAPRDAWIGWSDERRQQRLHLIVNNARFLIFPWVRSPNLASRVLSLAARRLRGDWDTRYGYRPVLLETFVEKGRFRGTCYQAANWHYLGETQGRGKLDRTKRRDLPIKSIYAYPLIKSFRKVLSS